MLLTALLEDTAGARELHEVAAIIDQSPAILKQFPNLPQQMRDLSTAIAWQPRLNIEMRRMLSQKMGMRLGKEFPDRTEALEEMQSRGKFDYDELQEKTNSLKCYLEKSFPGMTVLARTKGLDSIKNKLKSPDYQGKQLHHLKDLIGARIICPMKGTLPNTVTLLEDGRADIYRKRNYFRDNDDRPMRDKAADDYFGVNYLTDAGGWSAEIQMTVKPLEVWNDIQHVLTYKPAARPNQLLLEKLAHIRDNVLWHVFMGQR